MLIFKKNHKLIIKAKKFNFINYIHICLLYSKKFDNIYH
jgi:hypothetical protein